MSHVYLFSEVYVFLYLLNYITSLYWKLSENYKHGCRNDQPICKNEGCKDSNELSSNNLRFFQNNLGLVFHTTYSCIFYPCDLLLLFPLPHFPPLQFWPYRIFHSRIFSPPVPTCVTYNVLWVPRSPISKSHLDLFSVFLHKTLLTNAEHAAVTTSDDFTSVDVELMINTSEVLHKFTLQGIFT